MNKPVMPEPNTDGYCGSDAYTHEAVAAHHAAWEAHAATLAAERDALRVEVEVWFAVDVDALMEAATRAMTNCNFYAEIDGVAYSMLPTKDMAALSNVIMKAIGEKT